MFPLHDDIERMHGKPWLNYGLIGINVIVFVWEVITTGFFSDQQAVQEMFFIYGSVPDRLFNDFPASAPTVITSMFMHGGIAHIIGNMIFLFVFGDNIEDRYGRIKYLLMYPRARILTAIAVFFIYFVRIPVLIWIPFWFVLQVIFAVIGQLGPVGEAGVAYLAHIGGFAAGAATGLVWRMLPDSIKYKDAAKEVRVKPMFRNPMARKARPRIEDVVPTTPEVIEGPDYYEVIAEIRGVSDASDISARFEAETRQVRIIAHGTRKYELLAKLPDTAVNPVVKYIHYLNGIARIRLAK